jgi:hypothetical protein
LKTKKTKACACVSCVSCVVSLSCRDVVMSYRRVCRVVVCRVSCHCVVCVLCVCCVCVVWRAN